MKPSNQRPFHKKSSGWRPSKPRFAQPQRTGPTPEEQEFLHKICIDPTDWLQLEKGSSEYSSRIIDLLCPIGKGQRGLIVAPPKAGKTTILKNLAVALAKSRPELKIYCLLIDERPEEVTDFKRTVPVEVYASSNDKPYAEHVKTAQSLLHKVIPEVNKGADVVILLDSLTRLARVHNSQAYGNKTMSGGLDSNAMEIPRRFFGMARNIEGGGSLTILATILIETGSRMDDIIFQEFKGTGNMELVLSRACAEQRIFPAIDIAASGTRKEEKLIPKDSLEIIYTLRRALMKLDPINATSTLIELLSKHTDNRSALQWFKSQRG